MLTLNANIWRGEGPILGTNPIGFEVVGLPNSRWALIATGDHKPLTWQILQANDGVTGEWYGKFQSPEEAMATLL